MDWEAFAELLPEEAPYNLISWVRETQSGELGGNAYTVYRCERAAGEASMMDLFENRIRGKNIWATACTCTECGEVWLTRKGGHSRFLLCYGWGGRGHLHGGSGNGPGGCLRLHGGHRG